MIKEKLEKLGYSYEPSPLKVLSFHAATKVGNLVFTSGQIPILNGEAIKGKIGEDLDIETGKKAAEICAYNCLRAAGSVVDIESITRAVKVFGMVNVAEGFDNTSEIINGCSDFLNNIFGEETGHVRAAVGMVLPSNFAVEIEMVFEIE